MMKLTTFILAITLLAASCNSKPASAPAAEEAGWTKGTVQKLEAGKDGYTATLTNDKGDTILATISRTDMGAEYKTLEVGNKIRVTGDSLMLGSQLSIHARKVEITK